MCDGQFLLLYLYVSNLFLLSFYELLKTSICLWPSLVLCLLIKHLEGNRSVSGASTLKAVVTVCIMSSFFFNFYFYFILLYNTVLVLPYIDMNTPSASKTPQSHICSVKIHCLLTNVLFLIRISLYCW